ncbi:hypothetical protein PPERSA_02201 [Pseudocohnilembus persalinus]|uniref:Uncharacterized protein n=1 Tax=Pseudocohnilembus persalinus TaxID=266149 RepID=A0A0V0R1N4_PSEPJ|nr:hypothetical protein PPERSA_02201 [Pseudocohnilembus persalinus]|eukprot:KRX08069.1 hypothetical protein PPERSA_02201 [Pseudocohnilembus persalinus]
MNTEILLSNYSPKGLINEIQDKKQIDLVLGQIKQDQFIDIKSLLEHFNKEKQIIYDKLQNQVEIEIFMNGIVAYYYLLKIKPENYKPAYLDIHITINELELTSNQQKCTDITKSNIRYINKLNKWGFNFINKQWNKNTIYYMHALKTLLSKDQLYDKQQNRLKNDIADIFQLFNMGAFYLQEKANTFLKLTKQKQKINWYLYNSVQKDVQIKGIYLLVSLKKYDEKSNYQFAEMVADSLEHIQNKEQLYQNIVWCSLICKDQQQFSFFIQKFKQFIEEQKNQNLEMNEKFDNLYGYAIKLCELIESGQFNQ